MLAACRRESTCRPLDAVLFMSPKNSQVDIVQAVGRAMRKAKGKTYGYIVLPVAVPAGVDPAAALDDNERFAAVWGVLRALRSHDDRFDAEINQIDLNKSPTKRIIFSGDGAGEDGPRPTPEFPAVPTARPAAGRDLREDRRQVRRPEVLGDVGQRCRRDLLPPRPSDRRVTCQPGERGAR